MGAVTTSTGLHVNRSRSIRAVAGGNHGRGFDWKFEFFAAHPFESQTAALRWSQKYLKRQIGQKLRLRRSMASIESALSTHGVTIANVMEAVVGLSLIHI